MEFVTIPMRGPFGRGCRARMFAISNISDMLSTRSTPTRRNAASKTALGLGSPTARSSLVSSSVERRVFNRMMGLLRAISRAADKNARESSTHSRLMTMLLVRGSSPKWTMRSGHETSGIMSQATIALKPTPVRKLQSRTALHMALLWLINAMLPGWAMGRPGVRFTS